MHSRQLCVEHFRKYLSKPLRHRIYHGGGRHKADNGVRYIAVYRKTAVLPALIEEFAMRGVVMQSLRKYGDWFAIIMSSLVFALLHGNMVQIPFAFIAGIAIGYAVTVTGSMWTGVLIHFLNNLASIIMQIGIDNCSETVSAVITMSVVFVIMISGIICAAIYFKNYSHAYPLKNGESLVLSWNEKREPLW